MGLPHNREPGGIKAAGCRYVVLNQYASDHILVDIEAEGTGDLLTVSRPLASLHSGIRFCQNQQFATHRLQKIPRRSARNLDCYRRFLALLGAGGGMKPNGIREVARSIRVRSTNKINAYRPHPLAH